MKSKNKHIDTNISHTIKIMVKANFSLYMCKKLKKRLPNLGAEKKRESEEIEKDIDNVNEELKNQINDLLSDFIIGHYAKDGSEVCYSEKSSKDILTKMAYIEYILKKIELIENNSDLSESIQKEKIQKLENKVETSLEELEELETSGTKEISVLKPF